MTTETETQYTCSDDYGASLHYATSPEGAARARAAKVAGDRLALREQHGLDRPTPSALTIDVRDEQGIVHGPFRIIR